MSSDADRQRLEHRLVSSGWWLSCAISRKPTT